MLKGKKMAENHNSKYFDVFYTEHDGTRIYPETISGQSLDEAILIFEKRNMGKKVIKNPKQTIHLVKAEFIKLDYKYIYRIL
jgi:hypothetical protein